MISWLLNKKALVVETFVPDKEISAASGFYLPQTAEQLLNLPRRQKLLAHIWQRTSISRKQFTSLYLKPIERYVELVQQFPASETHHHAYPGGMIDHGLEIMAYALKLRQSYLLPMGSTPEEQTTQSEIWTAGIAYAALLHDIGKIAVDLIVEYENGQGWHPWHGPVCQPYRFRYRKDREYRLHNASTGLVYHQILDSTILDWLSQTPDLWAALLYVLSGQFEYAGVLSDIVVKADQASVAQELGGDPAKVMEAPKHSLQRKLLEGLRYLVKEQLKLNNAGPSDGWITDEGLWLVSKTVSDKLRAHLLSSGVSGIPEKNSAIFDVLQEHSIIQATKEHKAIWNATVSSASGWTNKFTFLKVSPALIWESNERPVAFSGTVVVDAAGDITVAVDHDTCVSKGEEGAASSEPTKNASIVPEVKAGSLDAVFNILGIEKADSVTTADHEVRIDHFVSEHNSHPLDVGRIPAADFSSARKAIGEEELEFSGEHFYNWLKEGILCRKLMINEPRALVHTVDNTLYLVTPGIFKRYALEFPEIQKLADQEKILEWRWVQKHFEKLGVHRKQPGGLNIWKCIVQGPRKTREVSGYLLTEPENIIQSIPFNNPYLKVKIED